MFVLRNAVEDNKLKFIHLKYNYANEPHWRDKKIKQIKCLTQIENTIEMY